MSGTWVAVTVLACICACMGMCILYGQMRYHDGYHDGRQAEKDRRARRARRELRETRPAAGIRAKTGTPGAPPWYVTVEARRTTVAMPGISMARMTPPRRATDTGELRALAAGTDLFINRITADGDAWRKQEGLTA